LEVLAVFLERLDYHKVLSVVEAYCSLVKPFKPTLTSPHFEQKNATEMLTALTKLKNRLPKDNIPTVINMSMGCHIGPHNGDSPLEEYISKIATSRAQRLYLTVSAG